MAGTLLLFVPTIVFGLINLIIFYQSVELDGRLASFATLLVAFVGVIAALQSTVKASRFTVTEGLIYSTIFTTLICMFYSLYLSR